jgi:NDP-sugar pyrophosphorylase family protein
VAIVGVIPAAGFARRLGRLPGSKEVLPVRGRPVLDYLVERIRAVAPVEVRVVTRPEKRDVVERARGLGAKVIEGRPSSVGESVRLGLAGLEPDDVVLLGFPDSVWEPLDGFAALVDALTDGVEVVLGCFLSVEPERSDVVVVDDEGVVRAVQVKPARPASDLIWGCCAARVRALGGLAGHAEPGTLFAELARDGLVRGVRFGTEFVDIGTPEALERLRRRLGGADHQVARASPPRPSETTGRHQRVSPNTRGASS